MRRRRSTFSRPRESSSQQSSAPPPLPRRHTFTSITSGAQCGNGWIRRWRTGLDYYPYGSQRIATGSYSEQRRYIGEEHDPETEFSYLNARYYQGTRQPVHEPGSTCPKIWVWIKETGALLADPLLQNAYAYSRGNPLIIRDDGGEFANVIIGAGGALAGQYLYDVYNNVHANGLSASSFYSNLSSAETYAVRAAQGAIIGATGGRLRGGVHSERRRPGSDCRRRIKHCGSRR